MKRIKNIILEDIEGNLHSFEPYLPGECDECKWKESYKLAVADARSMRKSGIIAAILFGIACFAFGYGIGAEIITGATRLF